MGLWAFIRRVLRGGRSGRRDARWGAGRPPGWVHPNFDLGELSRRLGVSISDMLAVPVAYDRFTVPKASGGERVILAPRAELKRLQRRILRRLLRGLNSHPAATGFERGQSIVTNARLHAGAAVVVRMDVRGFFTATSARRVAAYFRGIGWGREACDLLLTWCTRAGGLPQGAPTSPRLSNLVNYPMDARLAAVAERRGAVYTRYADDLTFSFTRDEPEAIRAAVRAAREIAGDHGYRLHRRRKLSIRRRHQSQRVTGLVVNVRPALPRETRRRLRAVAHHLATGRAASLTPAQLAGWRAFQQMIARQSRDA
jgi:RNA-directed DNA polymerase